MALPQSRMMQMALALCNVQVNEPTCDLIIRMVKAIEEKGGKLSLDEITQLEYDVQAEWEKMPAPNPSPKLNTDIPV